MELRLRTNRGVDGIELNGSIKRNGTVSRMDGWMDGRMKGRKEGRMDG